MNSAIGYSKERDAYHAGQEVIRSASLSPKSEKPDLVLAFCTNDLDQSLFVEGMLTQLPPDTAIVGGTTVGIICNEIISYKDHSAAALILRSDSIKPRIAYAEFDGSNEHEAGELLARRAAWNNQDRFAFLLYNMIKKERKRRKPPIMNSLLSILQGIRSASRTTIPIFGGGSIGDYDFSSSKLFCCNGVSDAYLLGITFSGDFFYDYALMHGCMPFDGEYHTITKNDGAIILEIDDRPAIEVLNDIYGSRDWHRELPVKEITIGVNLGRKYGPYEECNYVNRLIAGPLMLKKGIMTPEPDWQPGTEIQFMIRDNEEMIHSAQHRSEELLEKAVAAGKKPLLGLYIDCAGRTSYFSHSLTEEAAMVQNVFNKFQTPLFGFYSGFEIAPFFHESRGLEWSGVLILIAKD
jgi:hypothetical protein